MLCIDYGMYVVYKVGIYVLLYVLQSFHQAMSILEPKNCFIWVQNKYI